MPYLLDANIIIQSLNGDPQTIQLLVTLTEQSDEPLCVSSVTQMEVWEGVYRATDPGMLEREYERFFADLIILPFDSEVAKRGAKLRDDLRRQSVRTRERAVDLQIAATALFHDLTLVTYNTKDYDDIQGLIIYQP